MFMVELHIEVIIFLKYSDKHIQNIVNFYSKVKSKDLSQ